MPPERCDPMAMHHRYSHHVRRSLSHAERLATQYQHPHQDTAHLLVGVMLAQGSVGAQVMATFNVPLSVPQVYLKHLIDPLEVVVPNSIPRDESFEKALEQSADEATWLGSHYIGTEHLLLGITRTNEGDAIQLLRLLGITPEQIRRRVRTAINAGRGETGLDAVRSNARLSELSRRVLNASEQMALSMDHPKVGLGHLLLALSQERRGVTSKFLAQAGFKTDDLRAQLTDPNADLLADIQPVLAEAIDQAETFGSHYVGADHLLFALTLLPAGVALLQYYSAAPDKIHRLLTKHLQR